MQPNTTETSAGIGALWRPPAQPPARTEQFLLTVMVCVSVGALSGATGTQGWLLLFPAAISVLWRIPRAPRWLRAGTLKIARAFLGLGLLLGLVQMAYPVLPEKLVEFLILLSGYGLAVLAIVFLFGTPVWRAEATLVPVTLGLYVVGCLNPGFYIFRTLSGLGGATFAYLVVSVWRQSAVGGKAFPLLPRAARVAVFGLGAFLAAWGIIAWLPWAQGQVEQATYGLFSDQEAHYGSFSLQSKLGDLEELKVSSKVVMRVWTNHPQKLRGRVFTRFDGAAWLVHPHPPASLLPLEAAAVPAPEVSDWLAGIPGRAFLFPGHAVAETAGAGAIRTRIVQTVFNSGLLVAPGQKLVVRAPLENLRTDSNETLSLPVSTPVQIFGVINRRDGGVAQREAPSVDEFAETTAVPADTDPRFRELAAQLATTADSPEERILQTVETVRNACAYSLRPGKFHSRQPVAEFFFEKKRGYCQYFASAAAILLRLQGIPARYVTGFNVAEYNYRGGHLVVREADAHAWLEAYVPEKGWIEADPTPDAEFAAMRAGMRRSWMSDAMELAQAAAGELWIRVRQGDWGGIARALWGFARQFAGWLAGIALLAGLGFYLWQRWKQERRKAPRKTPALRLPGAILPAEMTEFLVQVDATYAARGFPRPAWRAPLEHLSAIPAEKLSTSMREASRAAVECYYRACFGGQQIQSGEMASLRQALDRASSA